MTVNVVIPSSTLGLERFLFCHVQPAFPLFLDWRLIYQIYTPNLDTVYPVIRCFIAAEPVRGYVMTHP